MIFKVIDLVSFYKINHINDHIDNILEFFNIDNYEINNPSGKSVSELNIMDGSIYINNEVVDVLFGNEYGLLASGGMFISYEVGSYNFEDILCVCCSEKELINYFVKYNKLKAFK